MGRSPYIDHLTSKIAPIWKSRKIQKSRTKFLSQSRAQSIPPIGQSETRTVFMQLGNAVITGETTWPREFWNFPRVTRFDVGNSRLNPVLNFHTIPSDSQSKKRTLSTPTRNYPEHLGHFVLEEIRELCLFPFQFR